MEECIWKVSPEDRLCRYCKLTHCPDRAKEGSRKLGTVMPTLRGMAVGDAVVLDAVSYNAARTAAFRLARTCGRRFLMHTRADGLHVERIC